MAATGRRTFLGAFVLAIHAETRDDLRDVLARMATSLSSGNFSAFFKPIDPAMPGYAELRQQIAGLTAYAELSSSVEIQSAAGDEKKQTAKVDWYLQLKSRDEQAVSAQRRETLRFDFEKRGKQWIVTRIEPVSIFNITD